LHFGRVRFFGNATHSGVGLRSHGIFVTGMQIRTETAPTHDKRTDRMTGGLIGASTLHLLVGLLIVLGELWPTQAPPQLARIVSVNLIRLGEKTASPSSPELALVPQEKAREVSNLEPAEAVPVAKEPPPQAAPRRAEEKSTPDLLTATKEKQKRAVPKPVKDPKLDAVPASRLPRPSPAEDELSAQLKLLAQLRQPAPPMAPNPTQQVGPGSSNVTASSANAALAPDASFSVKDFIRAQVERRWNLEGNMLIGGDWVVGIHIVLSPDGSVSRAEIVDNPRYRADRGYHDFALSARNAVLLSSPLTVPPGEYDIAKDIVVDFNSKQALR
jgi:outer membrane biosynthesis protein TonB